MLTFTLQSPYGDPVEPEKAPEAISKAVASLPPEQMFELMKQMKVNIKLKLHEHLLVVQFSRSLFDLETSNYAPASKIGGILFFCNYA